MLHHCLLLLLKHIGDHIQIGVVHLGNFEDDTRIGTHIGQFHIWVVDARCDARNHSGDGCRKLHIKSPLEVEVSKAIFFIHHTDNRQILTGITATPVGHITDDIGLDEEEGFEHLSGEIRGIDLC